VSTAVNVLHWTIRVSGALLILLGIAIWTGRADAVIPVHEFLGFVLVLSLWALAFYAARAGVPRGMVAAAVAWGVIAPILGLTQANLLTNNWHWTIQVLHLLVGLAMIGTGEGLYLRMRRRGAPTPKAA
jgi:hypothetical protein